MTRLSEAAAALCALGKGESPATVDALEKAAAALPYTAPELLPALADELELRLVELRAPGRLISVAVDLILGGGS
jgi:hypothetical protein